MEKSQIEILISVERYGNLLYCGEKKIIYLRYEGRYNPLKTGFGRKSNFGKREKNAVKVAAPKIVKSP